MAGRGTRSQSSEYQSRWGGCSDSVQSLCVQFSSVGITSVRMTCFVTWGSPGSIQYACACAAGDLYTSPFGKSPLQAVSSKQSRTRASTVAIGTGVGVGVAVGAGVGVGVGVAVGRGVGVAVGTGVGVGVAIGVGVGVAVGRGVGVDVAVGAGVGVGAGVAVGTGVGTKVGVGVGIGTNVGVMVGVGVASAEHPTSIAISNRNPPAAPALLMSPACTRCSPSWKRRATPSQ